MATKQRELFEKLSANLGFKKEQFPQTIISGLTIHVTSQKWDLQLVNDHIFSFSDFQKLFTNLQKHHPQGAQIILSINVDQPLISNELVQQYWPFVIAHSGLTNTVQQHLQKLTPPKISSDQQLEFEVPNEVVRNYYTDHLIDPLQRTYRKCGFPKLPFSIKVDKAQEAKRLQDHAKRKADQNTKLVNQALDSIHQQKVEQKKAKIRQMVYIGKSVPDSDHPQAIADLTQEAASVVVVGKIINKDLQTLYTGHQVLRLTLQDPSGSVLVKEFIRDSHGKRILGSMKIGLWLKIQGALRLDNLTQELAINAYSINPLPQDQIDNLNHDEDAKASE